MKRPLNNLTWFNGLVSRRDREELHGHPGFVIWFTGLSASGKSTIAHLVERELHRKGYSTYVLDGDNVRHGLCADLGFSCKDREENIRRIGEMANLFVDAGVILLTAFISPFRSQRQWIRSLIGEDRFLEVFVDCPLEVCASRDTKGLYRKALKGIIQDFTGISSPFEPPEHPDLIVHTDQESAAASSKRVLSAAEGLQKVPDNRKSVKQGEGAM